jgi:hypothetical protein
MNNHNYYLDADSEYNSDYNSDYNSNYNASINSYGYTNLRDKNMLDKDQLDNNQININRRNYLLANSNITTSSTITTNTSNNIPESVSILETNFITYHNNKSSKYFILNMKVKKNNKIFNFDEIHSRIIDWIELSISKSDLKNLNWNIGICYPDNFCLTNEHLYVNNKNMIDTKIIKVFLYINNTNDYEIDLLTLLYNNIPNVNNINIHTHKLAKLFNFSSLLLLEDEFEFINTLSISAVCYNLFELELKKYKDRYNAFNSQNLIPELINKFHYYKNTKYNFNYQLEEMVGDIDYYLNNLVS